MKKYIFPFILCVLASACTHHLHSQVFAYVPNSGTDNVSVINTTTNIVVATISVGNGPRGVSVSADGAKVYVTNLNQGNMSVISTATNTVITTIGVGSGAYGVAVSPDGSKVYITRTSQDKVRVIDTGTNSVAATITVGTNPTGVAVSPDGSKIYVTNQDSNDVSVIDASTNTVSATIAVGSNPIGVAVSPDGTKVYVANKDSNNISIINTSTNVVSTTIGVGTNPAGVSVSTDGTKIYVANNGSNNVSVINTSTNIVSATITVGTNPFGTSASPDGTKVYVANQGAGTVSVINTSTNTVSTTVTVAGAPFALGNMMSLTYCPPITFTNTTATNATVGTPYTLNASASNASSYSVSPMLPLGINLNTTSGTISGVPTVPVASATYTVTATQGNCSNTQTYTFAVACASITINPAAFPNAVVGSNYSQTLTQTGLTGTPAWSISAGILPVGLSILVGSNIISGIPIIIGTNNFTITVTDGTCTQTKAYSIVVACPALVFGITTAGSATVGTAYTLNAGVTGNVATVVYSISPSLPLGINLNTSTGAISGTPSAPVASATYTVTATQGTCTLTQGYTFAVTCPTLVFGVTTAGSATIGTAYSLNAGVTGNTAPITYSVNPTLPTGINLNTGTGIITGTSSVSVTSNTYTITARQTVDCFATQGYTFAVNPPACPTLTFNTASATNATVGTFYRLNPNVTGSTGGLIHTLSNSNLPIGLDFNPSTGEVSGTPTTTTIVASCTITATQGSCSVSQSYTFAVIAAPIPLAVPTTDIKFVPSPNVNTPNNVSFTWTSIAGATGYKVRKATTENANGSLVWVQLPIISGNTNTIYVDKDIKYDVAMYYSVQALSANAGLPSAWSSAISVIVTSYNNPISSLNNEESNKVIISPNPATDSFVIDNIDKNILGGEMMFVLTDATGKTVLTESTENGFPYKMNIANVANGLYYLKISNTHASKGMTKGNTMLVKKIVKLN